jgi:hypothetical protein
MRKKADLVQFSKEFEFLLDLVTCTQQGRGRDAAIPSDFNWPLFLELATHHRVLPLVHNRLQQLDPCSIPHEILHTLARRYFKNTKKMLKLSAEMEIISRTLSEPGIRCMMLKGPVLAENLYGDLSLRSSTDLDVLIPIGDLERADSVLIQLGYTKDQPLPGVLGDWKWRCHHDVYNHPEKRIQLEIHWRLHPGPIKEPHFDELWERKRTSPLTSHPVYLMGREDLFIYLAYHGARHGWFRLRWLVDVDRLVQQPIDWKLVMDRCKAYGNEAVAGQALLLASQLLQTPIAEPMVKQTRKTKSIQLAQDALAFIGQMINLDIRPLPQREEFLFRKYYYSLRSASQRLVYLLSLLYPSPLDAQALPLPSKLHFLYFALRPFLLVRRKLRGAASPQEGY